MKHDVISYLIAFLVRFLLFLFLSPFPQAFQKKMKKANLETVYVGGALEGAALTPAQIEKLETLPSKPELMAKVGVAFFFFGRGGWAC